ncbi:MAG: PilZ domain-containing protein [Magnetococcales bacterium]|nr:PilZ domain-containing protein [Magnetococcales bacterium]MBF0115899.1 PilZ domain-containing protein [Magnetococcales bacterium]
MVQYHDTEVQRRAYARVEDMLPLNWRQVSAEEYARVAVYFEQYHDFPPEPGDDARRVLTAVSASHEINELRQKQPNVAYIFEQLDAKLNLILRQLHPNLQDRVLQVTRTVISGSGIAFWTEAAELAVGDCLEMQARLAVDALATVDFFVRVLRLEYQDGLTQVSCCYDPIADVPREQIIQHVFRRQGDMLRAQRGM